MSTSEVTVAAFPRVILDLTSAFVWAELINAHRLSRSGIFEAQVLEVTNSTLGGYTTHTFVRRLFDALREQQLVAVIAEQPAADASNISNRCYQLTQPCRLEVLITREEGREAKLRLDSTAEAVVWQSLIEENKHSSHFGIGERALMERAGLTTDSLRRFLTDPVRRGSIRCEYYQIGTGGTMGLFLRLTAEATLQVVQAG